MNKKVCAGLDVHKDSVFAAISKGSNASEVKEFSTLTCSIKELCSWLISEGVKEVAMESTGIYWVPIWNILEAAGFKLMLVNPYFIKQMPGRKSDVKDAQWIALLLTKELLKGSLVPSTQIRTLRAYSREYVKLQQQITRVVQSIERILESANIRITSMTSRIESKTVLKIVSKIIEGETDIDKLYALVHGRIKNSKGEKVKHSLEGFIKEEHRIILGLRMEEYEMYFKQAELVENKMIEISEVYFKREIEILKTMPGVATQSAIQLIAETGGDMTQFSSSNKITRWAGLCPRNDESAGKIKSKATTKGNSYLRRIIVQIAWASSRTKGSHFQSQFQHLAVRKGNKKALIAVARKQLAVAWNMLRNNMPYDPTKQPVYSQEQIKAKKKHHEKELKKLALYLDN